MTRLEGKGFEAVNYRTSPDSSELSDGWIDAGHQQANGGRGHDLIDFNSQSQSGGAPTYSVATTAAAPAAAAAPATSPPPPPQVPPPPPPPIAPPAAPTFDQPLSSEPRSPTSTNNPFLKAKVKSQESTGGGERSNDGSVHNKRYTAAWDEVLSGGPPALPSPPHPPAAAQAAAGPIHEIGTSEAFDAFAQPDIVVTDADRAGSGKGKAKADESLLDAQPDDAASAFLPQVATSSVGASQNRATQESPSQASSSTVTASSTPLPPPPPRNQTYTIKHIRWLDHRGGGDSVRTTPILMQNLNGPCPLLALVNALTMSSPIGSPTSLVETLRTREQVSLTLLLEAVVEELMMLQSSKGGELPDMVELYDFLTALHTGMNVNPAFVPDDEQADSLLDLGEPLQQRSPERPGTFESTKELKLYATFHVPLVHGWLPPRSHPAFAALKRSARTHEDAENLITREDELEHKLSTQGLAEDEQRILEDIGSIKYFLGSSTTQLTGYGLDAIQGSMQPGSFMILFRNNHFSTLYKHPLTGHVFSLVTDMGYVKYDEIAWESLVDVNGAGAELFSGDFRVVSHATESSQLHEQPDYNDNAAGGGGRGGDQGWTTVGRSGRSVNRKPLQQSGLGADAGSSNPHEQEDADLALALQLQEEEEERQRQANGSNRRQASQQQQVPPRGGSSGQGQGQQQQQQSSHGRRPSQFQQAQSFGTSSRTQGGSNRLVIRNNGGNNAQNHRIFEDSSANSSTSNLERPLRGAQHSNSPFPVQAPAAAARARPATRRTDPDGPSEEAPPPTYEDALEDTPYIPPENSAHHHTSPLPSPGAAGSGVPVDFDQLIAHAQAQNEQQSQPGRRTHAATLGAGTSTTSVNPGSAYAPGAGASHGRRRSSGGNSLWPDRHQRERDKDCVVM